MMGIDGDKECVDYRYLDSIWAINNLAGIVISNASMTTYRLRVIF